MSSFASPHGYTGRIALPQRLEQLDVAAQRHHHHGAGDAPLVDVRLQKAEQPRQAGTIQAAHDPYRRRASSAPCASACSFLRATSRSIGASPQLVQGISRSRATNCRAAPMVSATCSGRFDLVAGDVDHAHHHVLALEQFHQIRRNMRVVALQADLLDASWRPAPGTLCSYWRHSLAEFVLPVVVGLNAVAVADVDSRGTGQPLRRALQRLDTPVGRVFHIDVESRLVKLDDVHAIGLQSERFPGSATRQTPWPS